MVRGIERPQFMQTQSNLKMGQTMSHLADKTIENKESCSVALQVEVLLDFFAELQVNRHHLSEKKQKTLLDGNDGKTLILVHIRSIDEKSYKVTEIINDEDDCNLERQVETDMTEDELQQFEEGWTNLWNSDITKKEIEKLHQ